jgi:hypothetical protein
MWTKNDVFQGADKVGKNDVNLGQANNTGVPPDQKSTQIRLTGEGKTTYTFSVSVNAFSVEFPLACYQQVGRVWYISGVLLRTYTLFYPAPKIN